MRLPREVSGVFSNGQSITRTSVRVKSMKCAALRKNYSFRLTADRPDKASELACGRCVGNDGTLAFGYKVSSLFDESLNCPGCSIFYAKRNLWAWCSFSFVTDSRIVPRGLHEKSSA